MLNRTVLAFSCLLGLAAGANAQTQPTAPPAAAPPTAAPPAASPPAASPPAATPPTAAAPAPAVIPATPVRIRGSITAAGPHTLTIDSRDGSKLEIALTDPLTVVTLKRVPLASIRNGAFVGIASHPGPKDTRVALEVLLFPEALRGTGEGDYPWDLQPGSMMTNAPVTAEVRGKSGRDLTLTYKTGTVTIHVPPRAPIVTFVPASAADLKPGRKVFIVARKDADGHLSTARVTVGTNGVNPPM
jgi:hypothetical protein